MKTHKIIPELICLILILNFFYDGVYKLAYLSNYAFWLLHAPLLKPLAGVLKWLVPIMEIGLSVALLVPSYRITALYILIGVLLIFVLWVMSACLFTNRIFWPYHALWHKPTWMQMMLTSIGLCWISLIAIFLLKKGLSLRRINISDNQNTIIYEKV